MMITVVKYLAIEKIEVNFTVLAENIAEPKQSCHIGLQMWGKLL
jgi:hypothetical protein